MDLEEVKKKIGKLNPAARLDATQPLRKTDIFPQPLEGGDAAGLVLETKEIMTGIRRLPKVTVRAAAAGPTEPLWHCS